MPHLHNRVDRHLGIRGWILLLCAAVWFLVGLGVMLRAAKEGDPSLFHLHIPAELRVACWWAGAALAVYGAVAKRNLPVVTGALIVMPLIRLISYMWGWITYLIPGAPVGTPEGWYSAAYHAVLVGFVLVAAHVKEPTRDPVT